MNLYKFFGVMAGSVLLTSACTDFSDYNEAYTGGEILGSDMTLWENISSDANLSEFAALVKKGGFAEKLSASQFYTVWAPVNGSFNSSEFEAMDSATLVKKFLNNHIARGNVQLSGNVDKRVHTLNEKSYKLQGYGAYTYGDYDVLSGNLPSINGTMHTINGAQEFRPNVYEYIFEAENVDSIREYFKRYEVSELDESKSVEGPIVDGKQTFLDSVMVVYNSLSDMLDAKISNEDSSYTMLIPTNDAYVKAYDKISQTFNYIDAVPYTNLSFKGSTLTSTAASRTIDGAYYKDSLTRLNMVGYSIFSNNDQYNKNGYPDDVVAVDDTIRTTTRGKLSNVAELLGHTINRDDMEMSNGYVRVVDSLAYRPWETWNPERYVSPSSSMYMPGATSCTVSKYLGVYTDKNAGIEESFYYADLVPNSDAGAPQAYFYLPNVGSGAYNIYCVFVSPLYGGTLAREYKVNFTLTYSDASGKQVTESNDWKNMETHFFTKDDDGNVSDAIMLDTVCVTSKEPFTFPVSYYSLFSSSTPCAPYFTVKSARAAYNKTTNGQKEWDLYDNELRIAAIILRPVEYDEYLKKDE